MVPKKKQYIVNILISYSDAADEFDKGYKRSGTNACIDALTWNCFEKKRVTFPRYKI